MVFRAVANLEINQKSSFMALLYATQNNNPTDLTDYEVEAKLKPDFFVPDKQAINFEVEIRDAANGEITISLSPEQTANLNIQQKYVYDVAITNNTTGFKTRILEGRLKISGGIT